MLWNLRMQAARRGIWKSGEMRRLMAEYGLQVSAGKMSALWTGTIDVVRLDELDVICAALGCSTADLLVPEPDKVATRRPPAEQAVGGEPGPGIVRPRPNGSRPAPPL